MKYTFHRKFYDLLEDGTFYPEEYKFTDEGAVIKGEWVDGNGEKHECAELEIRDIQDWDEEERKWYYRPPESIDDVENYWWNDWTIEPC